MLSCMEYWCGEGKQRERFGLDQKEINQTVEESINTEIISLEETLKA